MSAVETVTVTAGEAGQRLDRWLKRRFPSIPHGHFQKWLRTGQVRVDGKRAKANLRLETGQAIRIPPVGPAPSGEGPRPRPAKTTPVTDKDAADLLARVLYRDEAVIAIDKPAGLAVQGGSGTLRHLDGMLDALRFGSSERPRLVHRLDRDTSGVLLLARTAAAASYLTAAFRTRAVRKLYWALVVGVPAPLSGRIDLPLGKRPGPAGEKVEPDAEGKRAETLYRVIDRAGKKASWMALEPLTGRTHQLRAHAAALGTPIIGDGKYGGSAAFLAGEGIGRGLHLCARQIRLRHPSGRILDIAAPLPPHMLQTLEWLGFYLSSGETRDDPFGAFED